MKTTSKTIRSPWKLFRRGQNLTLRTRTQNPKDNLNPTEREALKALKRDTNINLKKADKGTTIVVLNIEDKIKEGRTQLDNREN